MRYFGYVDYTLDDPQRPFYIGIGNFKRVNQMKRNRKHSNVVKQYGQRRVVELMCDDWAVAKAWEIGSISAYETFTTSWCFTSGLGCNFTKGGDGTVGLKHTLLTRAMMSELRKGTHPSEETRRRIGLSKLGNTTRRGKKHRVETLIQMSIDRKGKSKSPRTAEHQRHLNEARLGKSHTCSKCGVLGHNRRT